MAKKIRQILKKVTKMMSKGTRKPLIYHTFAKEVIFLKPSFFLRKNQHFHDSGPSEIEETMKKCYSK